MTEQDHPVILFDGVCAVCNRFTQIVLERDRVGLFHFAPIQGQYAQQVLRRMGRDPEQLTTVFLVLHPGTPQEKLLDRSDAVLWIARRLGGAWSLLAPFQAVPKGLRDAAYSRFAAIRYRVFGKQELCLVPEPHWRERFIEDAAPGA